MEEMARANAGRRKERPSRLANPPRKPDPSAERYLDQYKAIMALVGRLSLSLMGIIAFWMAIEINHEHREQIVHAQDELKRGEYTSLSFYKIAKGGGDYTLAQRADFTKKADEQSNKNDEIRKDVKDLRKENVAFSILGTTILSPAGFGPLIWLASVLIIALMIHVKRTAAVEALAAYLNRVPPKSDVALAAGDGSMWLAPLPIAVRPPNARESDRPVSRDELCTVLGWTEEMDSQYRIIQLMIFGLIGLGMVRVTTIYFYASAHVLPGEDAPLLGQLPRTFACLLLVLLCLWSFFLLLERKDQSKPHHGYVPVGKGRWLRRDALAVFAAAAIAGGIAIPREVRLHSKRWPRFVSARKRARRNLREVFANTRFPPGRLIVATPRRRPSLPALFVSSSHGKVRLPRLWPSSRPDGPIGSSELRAWMDVHRGMAGKGSTGDWTGKIVFDRKQSVMIEAAALSILEHDPHEACTLLLLGAELCFRACTRKGDVAPHPMNLRLLDLLAGLAVRKGYRETHLQPLLALIADPTIAKFLGQPRYVQSGKMHTDFDRIKQRMDRWRTGKWEKRWTAPTPVYWHYPLADETEWSLRDIFRGKMIARQRRVMIA